jgi:dihydrolipoamide dehydrogenase
VNDSHVDVIVLGAGPGGYVAAIRCAQLGMTTAIAERGQWGGVCLNLGCIPSKALLRHAEIADIVTKKASTFGIRGEVSVDYAAAYSRSRAVASGRAKGIHYLMSKNDIRQFNGTARFLDAHTMVVDDEDRTTVTFDHAIIATGATPRLLPGTVISDRVVTYAQQILAEELPSSVAIVGAGAVGVEFAYLLNAFGVETTLIEYADRILPLEDADVSAELAKRFRRAGITVLTATTVGTIADSRDCVTLEVSRDGVTHELHVDKVLQAIGFTPQTRDCGLEAAGVALTDAGAIAVDACQRTNISHIYAIGDVTAQMMLAHVAEAQGLHAAATIAGLDSAPLNYPMMPRATFCHPQVASFGWTERQARERAEHHGWDVAIAQFPFTANGKAHGMGETAGFVKVISDKTGGELLGAHMIGPDVAELLPELTLAQRFQLSPHDLASNVHAHPTLGEALQEAFHGLSGHMINY